MYGWKTTPDLPIRDAFKRQKEHVNVEFEQRSSQVFLQLNEQVGGWVLRGGCCGVGVAGWMLRGGCCGVDVAGWALRVKGLRERGWLHGRQLPSLLLDLSRLRTAHVSPSSPAPP